MIIDMPATTSDAVARRMVELREKHGAVALGRVLTLVMIADEEHAESAIEAANEASHEHPCRIVAVLRGSARGSARLDAQLRVGGDAGASEVVVLRMFGPLTAHPASVVVPFLLPDAPVVAWWPADPPQVPATDPVGQLAQRRITDAASCRKPAAELRDRAEDYQPGDTDLAWSRITHWRAIVAAVLDQPPFERVTSARVVAASESPSADLMAGWLALKLRCPVTRTKATGVEGMLSVRLDRESGPLVIERPTGRDVAVLSVPGRRDRRLSLPRRDIAECLAEELRRLDPDEVYHEVLVTGLQLQRDHGRTTRMARPKAGAR